MSNKGKEIVHKALLEQLKTKTKGIEDCNNRIAEIDSVIRGGSKSGKKRGN